MTKLTTAYIGLGGNLGDRQDYIRGALKKLAENKHIDVGRVSDVVETAALAQADQPEYLNAVAEIKTTLSAEDLYKTLADIETGLDRVRNGKWSSRTIDLDLLLFGREVISTPDLTVPHRQMHLRSFVLKGLSGLNGDLLHPVLKEPVSELAARLNGSDFAPDPNLPQLVSVAGIIGVGKTTLAKKLSNWLGCKILLEPYDTNPFMPDVYAGKKELALDSQLYFLTSRTSQLNHNTLAPRQIAVSDYIFDKELIYARRLLNAQQLALYEEIYPSSAAKVAAPVLVIYMQDSPQKCLERIHRRNHPYEQQIELQYLEALHRDYQQLFADWKTCPFIRISMLQFDCTRDSDIEHLANQVRYYVAGPAVIASASEAI
jgi:2-amino-4-hydroxy-6-hydroxymethyldihydropteridine diphosphokinase